LTDIHNNPSAYLNGTAPLVVNGYSHHCNLSGADCVASASPDSYEFYDELHPSQQTDRIIARTFVDVVKGGSKWATYWSS
jgi:phospholipase/lecithinase/hemolysin